jgi:trk system potassium uptake protein TrkA|tara:strand:+ start:220 stop:1596 length:1377 start_codon:yes stop_codon:yes gene_type:complete
MRIIICGAGQVGFSIAKHLAQEGNDVVVIDHSTDLARKVSDTLDVKAITGFASEPAILEQAGAADAELLIAVTHSDEVNMVACQIAHSLFDVTTKIARIRNQGYLEPKWGNLFTRDNMPIDVIISPEQEVADSITGKLRVPGAFESISLVDGKVMLVGVRCTEECPIVNTPLKQLTQLFPGLDAVVVGIVRGDMNIIPNSDEQLLSGDGVYVVVETSQLARLMTVFGHDEVEARRLVIFGGGNIGLALAQRVEEEHTNVNIKVVEADKITAEAAARNLKRSVVIQGNVLDTEILEEANVSSAEAVVAVTNDDEANILASLLAKRGGSSRAITLVNNNVFETITPSLGIDVIVNPRNITVSSILQHVRRGRIQSVYALQEGFGEIICGEALETSELVGDELRNISLPDGVLVGAIVQDNKVILPRGATVIQPHDIVVLFSSSEAVKQVEQLFSVGLEFF